MPNPTTLTIDGVIIHITRKNVKNINLRLRPSDGSVRVSAPRRLPEARLLAFLNDKLPWIRKKQAILAAQPRPAPAAYVTGEMHPAFGRRYPLEFVERPGRAAVRLADGDRLIITAPAGTGPEKRARLLEAWYRAQLKVRIPPLLEEWEPIIDRPVAEWGVKKMKTRWGSCNIQARRIWLSLALAQKPPECLEYVVVHEMVHLHERYHNARFWGLMDRYLPDWRRARDLLKPAAPLPARPRND